MVLKFLNDKENKMLPKLSSGRNIQGSVIIQHKKYINIQKSVLLSKGGYKTYQLPMGNENCISCTDPDDNNLVINF